MFGPGKRKKHNQVRDWPQKRDSTQYWGQTANYTSQSSPPGNSVNSRSRRLCSSVDSLTSTVSDTGDVTETDMQLLNADVDRFSQAVSQLKTTLSAVPGGGHAERAIDAGPSGEEDSEQPTAQERAAALVRWLGEVKTVVISVLNKHPRVHSTSIFSSLGSLMSKFKDHCEESVENVPGTLEALEQLTQAFITSVTEYMQGDMVDPHPLPLLGISRESSMESVLNTSQENVNGHVTSPSPTPHAPAQSLLMKSSSMDNVADEMCSLLMRLENGMDVLLDHCKLWSRFVKELSAYVEKKAQIKIDYCSRMMKLTRIMRETLVEMDGFGLPFCSPLNVLLEQDLDLFRQLHDAFKTQVFVKFIEPLTQHREEHEKTRKTIKENWGKHQKKVADSVAVLRKSRHKYIQLCEDRDRASAKTAQMERDESGTASKLERKKQQEEDSKVKASEAENVYKQCVDDANQCLANMETFRNRTLDSMCHAFIQYEGDVRSAICNYTHLERELVVHVPDQISKVDDGVNAYPLGSQLTDTIRSHADLLQSVNENGTASSPVQASLFGRFYFEPFGSPVEQQRSASDPDLTRPDMELPPRSYTVTDSLPFISPSRKPGGLASLTARLTSMVTGGSGRDSDSEMGSRRNLAVPDRLPAMRAAGQRRKRPSSVAGAMVDGIRVTDEALAAVGAAGGIEQSPGRHLGRKKLRVFTKDQFRAKEVSALHTEDRGLQSQRKRTGLSRRPTFFGVDLCRQLRVTGRLVPLLVSRCVEELNERGLTTQGLYRVPAAQSKIKDLCTRFETDAEGVDLSNTAPHVMASVLKFYLRQLPQPLLTFKLYPQFVNISKKWQNSLTSRRLHKSKNLTRSQSSLTGDIDDSSLLGYDQGDNPIPRSTSHGVIPHPSGKADGEEREEQLKGLLDPLVSELKAIVDQLSKPYYSTAAMLIDHLTKVAAHEAENQMNASNLAIVFGPNILRPRESQSSLSTLTDMQHQLKAVEMLIKHPEVFDSKQYKDDVDTKESVSIEEGGIDESSDEDQDEHFGPRLRRHSSADLLGAATNPGTPPLRKRQSMTELEDLFSAVADANSMRLNTQRSKVAMNLDGSETPNEEHRHNYAEEFEALQSDLFHRRDNLLPLIRRPSDDADVSDPEFSPPGVVDDHENVIIRHGLSPPTRLSPLSQSLADHFDLNIRIATSPSSSVMNTVMREAARAAQSTDTASKRLSHHMATVQGDESPKESRRTKSQSPVGSPVPRTVARRTESDVSRFNHHLRRATDEMMVDGSAGSRSSDEDVEGSSVLELLITGSPQSQSRSGQRSFVSAATVAHKMHTTTLEEDVGRRASNHTHTCTATLLPSESPHLRVEQSLGSLASLREDITGLMQRFDEQISVLETPPGSPAFIRRRARTRMKHKKTRSEDNLVTKVTMERSTVDSAVQSLDSLISTSEELLASPCDPGTLSLSPTHHVITVSSEQDREQPIEIKTESWRGNSSSEAISSPGEVSSPRATHRDSGISVPLDSGSFETRLKQQPRPRHVQCHSLLCMWPSSARRRRFSSSN